MGEEKVKRPKWKTLLAMLFIVWTICLFAVGISEKSAIPCVFGVVFAIGAALLFRKETPERIEAKKKKAGEKAALARAKQEALELQNRTIECAKHQIGLPLAQDIPCRLIYQGDCVEILGGGTTFRLPIEKVRNITITTDAEIQRQYVSDSGAAIAGAMAFDTFGPFAASILGKPKAITDTKIRHFLIITYKRDEQIDYISFEVVGELERALRFITEVNSNRTLEPEIVTL